MYCVINANLFYEKIQKLMLSAKSDESNMNMSGSTTGPKAKKIKWYKNIFMNLGMLNFTEYSLTSRMADITLIESFYKILWAWLVASLDESSGSLYLWSIKSFAVTALP